MTALATQELARARAARIRAGIQTYVHTLADIAAAYAERDWTALGYADWQAYVDGEYGAERLRLTPEARQSAVRELRLAGMSQRAIGTTLGVSKATVANDLAEVVNSDHLPEVRGTDGKTYSATRPQSTPSTEPAVSCEACGAQLPDAQAAAGYMRCEDCDSEGEHYATTFPVRGGPCELCSQTPATTPEPGAAPVDVPPPPATDHPPTTGEADARLDAAVQPAASEAPTGVAPPVGAGDSTPPPPAQPAVPAAGLPRTPPEGAGPTNPLDDPTQIEADRRQRSSQDVAAALVSLLLCLDPDPIRWVTRTWQPDAYRNRDLPRVRTAFTTDGLRLISKHLDTIADHLDHTGGSL